MPTMIRTALIVSVALLAACASPTSAPVADAPRPTRAVASAATPAHVDHHMAEAADVVAMPQASPAGAIPHALLHPGAGDPTVCICDWARSHNGWCEKCRVGYVSGVAVPSALLFETLDPHGHVISHDSIECPNCRAAIADDGWCETCRIGWKDGLAWMTRITWTSSKGRPIDAGTPLCESCRAVADADPPRAGPWCAVCNGGVVARGFFADPELWSEAVVRFGILSKSIETLPRCEMCACAIVYDEECPDCRIRYRDGRPVGQVSPSR